MAVISRSTAVIIGPKGDPGPAGPAGAALGFPSQARDTVATPALGQTGFFDTSNSSVPTTKDTNGRIRNVAYQSEFLVTDPQFGAKADGVADDSSAFEACLAAAAAVGGVVRLAPGSMNVGSTITLPSHVRILGQFAPDAASGSFQIGSQINFTSGSNGFLVPDGSSDIVLDHLYIYTTTGSALAFAAGTGIANIRCSHVSINHRAASVPAITAGSSSGGCGLEFSSFEHLTIALPTSASKEAIALYGGALNTVSFPHLTIHGPGDYSNTAAFVHVEGLSGAIVTNIHFEHVQLEEPVAGGFVLKSVTNSTIADCWAGDLQLSGLGSPTAPLISILKSSTGGAVPSGMNVISGLQSDTSWSSTTHATVLTDYATDLGTTAIGCFLNYVDNGSGSSEAAGSTLVTIGCQVNSYNGQNRPLGFVSGAVNADAYAQPADIGVGVVNGVNSNLAGSFLNTWGYWYLSTGSLSAGFSIDGVLSQGLDGQELTIYNPSSRIMTLVDTSTSASSSGNKIACLRNGTNVPVAGPGWAKVKYDLTLSQWFLVGTSGPPGTSAVSMINGANADVANPGTPTWYVTGPTGAFSIAGIAAGYDGQQLTIVNASGQAMTIKNQDSSDESSAANRIMTPSNADAVFTPVSGGFSYVSLVYMGAVSGLNRWVASS